MELVSDFSSLTGPQSHIYFFEPYLAILHTLNRVSSFQITRKAGLLFPSSVLYARQLISYCVATSQASRPSRTDI